MPSRVVLSSRPSIREIAASILTPTTSRTCAHRAHIIRRSVPNSSVKRFTALSSNTPRHTRGFHVYSCLTTSSVPPRSHDRGPPSTETTQTDFSNLDVLGSAPVPSTAIDACLWDGFHLNNGVKIGNGAGVLLVAGEAFAWRPWDAGSDPKNNKSLLNKKGQWEVPDEAWGVLSLVHPKPDLLILGVGPQMAPLSPATRAAISKLGIRVEIQDTRNASAQFNLLATERGVGTVAAGLVPVGWREGKGIISTS